MPTFLGYMKVQMCEGACKVSRIAASRLPGTWRNSQYLPLMAIKAEIVARLGAAARCDRRTMDDRQRAEVVEQQAVTNANVEVFTAVTWILVV